MNSLSEAVQVEQLLREHQQALAGFVQRRVANWPPGLPDREDILQEVYLRAKERWPSFVSNDDLAPRVWLYHMARDVISAVWEKAVALKRGLGKVQDFASDSRQCEAEQLAESFSSVGSRIARQELLEIAAAMLAELKDSYREVLTLRFVDGMSVDEVAAYLEQPRDSIRTREFRATVKLRGIWKERFPDQSFRL